MAVAPERRRLVVIRGVPSEADAHAPCPPPVAEVTLGRVLRIAGLLIVLSPVVLGGAAVAGWIAWQIALWLYGVGVGA
jgi:hypothetical protein